MNIKILFFAYIDVTADATKDAATSDLDVNSHNQNESFVDKDNDTIEDLSVDHNLAAEEKKEHEQEHEGEDLKPVAGTIPKDLLKVDDSMPDEYDEEITQKDGTHIHKHVRKGNGFQEVQISSDKPLAVGDILGQIMG